MAIYLDDIKDMRLTRTPFYLPINEENKKKNSSIFLMTPNLDSSIQLMQHPLTINRNLFESYYIEKDIAFILNELSQLVRNDVSPINESLECVLEGVQGISDIIEEDYTKIQRDSFILNEDFVDIKMPTDEQFKIFFGDSIEEIVTEAGIKGQNYSTNLRKLLYSERIKNQKECTIIFDKIKNALPFIKYTFLRYTMYKQKNLFVDWSYYTQTFFKNNIYKLDRGIDLFFVFINKFLEDRRLAEEGYNLKTVFIPINAWSTPDTILWDYTKSINPISMIYRLFRQKRGDEIRAAWKDYTFVFMSDKAYFKINFNDFDEMKSLPMFTSLISKLNANDIADAEYDAKDSSKVITHNIVDNIEKSGITINNLTGGTDKLSREEIINKISVKDQPTDTIAKDSDDNKADVDKAALVSKIKDIADKSSDEQNAMDNLNADSDSAWVKQIIVDLQSEDGPNVNSARKSRINKLNNDFLDKKINNSRIEDFIKVNASNEPLQKDNIPIKSINEEWQNVTFTSFNKEYNLDADIYKSLVALNNKSNPIAIIDVQKEDTSTSEDYIETWTIKCEDINGKRFTLKLDIPQFKNNRFLKLRGNLKIINGQLLLLPIIKTDEDTAQIVSSSYNKIFIQRVNPSNGAKTTRNNSILIKFLKKYDGKDMIVTEGDNSFTCQKYELPIEYRDLAGLYSKIEFKDGAYISFDMDELMSKKLEAATEEGEGNYVTSHNQNSGIRYYVNPKGQVATTPDIAPSIMSIIAAHLGENCFKGIKPDKRLSYSEASILNTDIPVIVVMAYSEGLQTAMQKAGITFKFEEKRPSYDSDFAYIKFEDGYISYIDTPSASLLLNGLASCNTEDYSIKEINKKEMWLDFLDNFGGRIKADGLDNFYDCMFDPITVEICESYKLPSDYVTALAYASGLLTDTKFNNHTDISGNRIRTNEIVAAYLDKALSKSYGEYRNQLKRNKKDASMTIKQSAVIDAILTDNTCADLSILNDVLTIESSNTFGFKGLSGMNSDRSYNLDKRTYDDSMLGVLATSTGFAANVGITRQASINSSIVGTRGMIVSPKAGEINTLNTLSVYEALNPYCTTHDDPIRVAMGFTQSTKHQMRVKRSHPNLITMGMDEALAYMTPDIFAHKFHGKKGKVLEITDNYIIFEDTDTKVNGYIPLKEIVMKNSDGGFFVIVKLNPNVKKGQILKNNDILAYDRTSYSNSIGSDKTDSTISYNNGTMAKIAIMPTDEGYEDSAVIDNYLSDSLTSSYCVKKERVLPKDTNIYNLVKKGDPIEEGDPLLVFQNAFEEKDTNALLRSITDDDLEAVSDLGRIQLRSKLSGWIEDIKIYRTCEIDELSPSLKKLVLNNEKEIKKEKDILKKYNVKNTEQILEPDYKLSPTGKLKGTIDGILIEFYIKCEDKMGIGDKLSYNNAIKGVVKKIMKVGDEPTTKFRPNEPIDALLTTSAVNARMVSSIITLGAITKGLIELDRLCKEKLGIPWKNLGDM